MKQRGYIITSLMRPLTAGGKKERERAKASSIDEKMDNKSRVR